MVAGESDEALSDEKLSDEKLMALSAAGNHRAFRALMLRHMPRAIRVAQATLASAADADEVAQEAFVRVWRRAASFDPRLARFTTWLHQIVVNLSIDRLRRPRTEPLDLAEDVAADEPGALNRLIAAEEQDIMTTALSSLPERQRAAIALFHFEGLSGHDSAAALEISEKAFESLLIRARAALKARVEGAQKQAVSQP